MPSLKPRLENPVDLSPVDGIVNECGRTRDALIPILHRIQNHYHYLPQPALERVCEITDITPAALVGVATFYTRFRHSPAGRNTVKICVGTACHVQGADHLHEACRHELGIPGDGDTDPDGVFTLEKAACLGCCMLAPVVQVEDVTYGHLEPKQVPGMLRDFLAAQAKAAQPTAPAARSGKPARGEIRLCQCSSCRAAGADAVAEEIRRQISERKLPATIKPVGCRGISYQSPLVEISLNGSRCHYGRVSVEDVRGLLLSHFQPEQAAGRVSASVSRMLEKLLTDEAWEPVTRYPVNFRSGPDAPFVEPQVQIATEYSGELDPLDIEDYLAHEGFKALAMALKENAPGVSGPNLVKNESPAPPDEGKDGARPPGTLIGAVYHSGLRGRGGAGFLTGDKWRMVAEAGGNQKYVIANGDEGDPGAFMDRLILESFPFRVIEGLAVAAVAVGASQGFLYIRAEYPLAIRRVREALRICEERGFIGRSLMGSGKSLDLKVVEGAGAFVCGEETALIASIEGRRGMPRIRPPFPAQNGLWGKPTLINNVETLALVPWIIRHGPEAFAAYGTATSKGTKTFALAGKINRSGLIEVPMGITLREIIYDIGGGIPSGRAFKAVQVGGPSGGCVPDRLIDTPVDYDSLAAAGAIMGSGGMVVLDETDCMVDMARYFLSFTQAESCGKCTPCRVGTKRMLEILDRLCTGQAKAAELEELEELARTVSASSLCGLGKTAPNPVRSTLAHFREEYEAHLRGECPALKCEALISYRITDQCIGCTLCAQRCPVEAIPINPYRLHEIIADKCIRCDTCKQICPEDAIVVESRRRV